MNSSCLCSGVYKLLALLYAPNSEFVFCFLAIGGADVWGKCCSLHFASNVDSVKQKLIQIWLLKHIIN